MVRVLTLAKSIKISQNQLNRFNNNTTKGKLANFILKKMNFRRKFIFFYACI